MTACCRASIELERSSEPELAAYTAVSCAVDALCGVHSHCRCPYPALLQDRVDIEWLSEVTSSLRFGGEADTRLYCWLAKDGVLGALLEVAEELGLRPGQVRGIEASEPAGLNADGHGCRACAAQQTMFKPHGGLLLWSWQVCRRSSLAGTTCMWRA